jgi:DNA-binding MurR/RpiR family transcriptional regulator
VYLVGGRWSGALAEFGALHLGLLRPGVHAVPQPPAARRALLLDLERRCVVVAFDYRRYQRDTIAFGADAARAGASLVLFTDHLLSPLAAHACVVLTSSIDAGSPFTVLTPALALLETLVTRVLDRIGPASVARMARLDALAEGVFVPGGGPGDERIPDEAPAPKEST